LQLTCAAKVCQKTGQKQSPCIVPETGRVRTPPNAISK